MYLVGPFMILYAIIYVAPIVYSVGQSLFTLRSTSSLGFGGVKTVFVGFENYLTVLQSGTFWASMLRIVVLGLVQVPAMLILAVALALLIDSKVGRGNRAFRLFYFLPYAIPGVIAGILWSYLYGPNLSPIVEGFADLGITVDFLGRDVVLWSIANMITWSWAGYNMLIALSALQSVPREIYEAAKIDGANEWQVALQIKLPHLRPALILSGTLSIIGTVQTFNEPKVLSVISPFVTSEYVPTMAALQAAFGRNDFGVAASTSVLIALFAGVLSAIYYRVTSRQT
ncbi:carbohydrate ABC transporter permease [uncultured Microbacterium sp.]|uniref:carbohydrate ABC transporter permease n=1 Tax=uncultured Microbacterium sp. TaxID=191216 RepID=UPI0035CA0734